VFSVPVTVDWDDHCSRCILFAINGGWVWDDFQAAMVAVYQLSDASEHDRVAYIFDVRDGHVFPRDVLYKIRRIRIQLHEKANLMIVVGDGTFAQALMQLLETMAIDSTTQIKQVITLEEAYALIEDSIASSDE
jgi:hypothetical protein